MTKFINNVLLVMRYILFILSFSVTIYGMNSYFSYEIFVIIIPYILLLIAFVVDLCFKRRKILNNCFYNLTACLVFGLNIFIIFKSLYGNMMLNSTNYNYFNVYYSFFIIMLYGLFWANILFLISSKLRVISVKIES